MHCQTCAADTNRYTASCTAEWPMPVARALSMRAITWNGKTKNRWHALRLLLFSAWADMSQPAHEHMPELIQAHTGQRHE